MAYLLGFNNNIRCIEIKIKRNKAVKGAAFNNNIRCIEIVPRSCFTDSLSV